MIHWPNNPNFNLAPREGPWTPENLNLFQHLMLNHWVDEARGKGLLVGTGANPLGQPLFCAAQAERGCCDGSFQALGSTGCAGPASWWKLLPIIRVANLFCFDGATTALSEARMAQESSQEPPGLTLHTNSAGR